MSFELPLFPLNTVLFPGMPLPLHIFEPRYRVMMSRCLASTRIFGVTLALQGEDGALIPAGIGCTAFVVQDSHFRDGRMNIQTEGRRRFRVLSLREEDDYLIANAEWLDDIPDENADTVARQVRASLRRYLAMVSPEASSAVDDLDLPRDATALSYWVATLLTLPDSEKQELLEEESLSRRLRTELEMLRRACVVHQAFARRISFDVPGDDEPHEPNTSYLWLN
jgi:Lon protease-like protein